MQFFLDDSEAIPIQLFSASNAPRGQFSPRNTHAPVVRGNRSVPGYPYIRFTNDDDYDGSYPFDAFQDLRSAYTSSSLHSIQEQMRSIQAQRAQIHLRRSVLAQQQRAFDEREKELLEMQRQLERQRDEQAQRASEQARRAYLSRVKNENKSSGFQPPFQFFDHILSNQLREQDNEERKQAHTMALEDLLDSYFSERADKQKQKQKDESEDEQEDEELPLNELAKEAEEGDVQLPEAAVRGPHLEPGVLDSVLRVVHDRLAEISAQEEAEKEAKQEAEAEAEQEAEEAADQTSDDVTSVNIVNEPSEGQGRATKIRRNSPQSGVEVEEPTDYERLANLLRGRVQGLSPDAVFIPPSPELSSHDEDTTEPELQMDVDGQAEHTDSEFADMMSDCKSQLQDIKEGASVKTKKKNKKHRNRRRQRSRAHGHAKDAKVGSKQPRDAIEDVILGSSGLSAEARKSLERVQEIGRQVDNVRREYSQQLRDTQLSFVADNNGNLRLAYNSDNSVFHAYHETLEQLMLRLDAVPSHGSRVVRARRKAVVKKVQAILDSLDELAAMQEQQAGSE
ncbi:hypothetical protein IWW49_002870 [Coemansia sp. RSA 1797]|nr:hypothetical protein IWW49_002870 [Coemansia sp. RSA 1797]